MAARRGMVAPRPHRCTTSRNISRRRHQSWARSQMAPGTQRRSSDMPGDREGAAPAYRLGSRERRGLLAGWRGGQVGCVAIALLLAVGMLRVLPSPAGMVGAILAVLGGAGLACWPVRGRAADEWLPALG